MYQAYGKLHILEVNPLKRTPISADIGTFLVPLSTHVLIETHKKGVSRTNPDKDLVPWIGNILKSYFSLRYIGNAKSIKCVFFCKIKSKGFKYKKSRIFMKSLKFTVLHDNKFYCYILCITYFSVRWTVLYATHLFREFYMLIKPL